VRWLAFLDTSSRVVYKNFFTPQLNKARAANTVAVRNVYVRFGKLYEKPPTVAPFLIGMVAPGGRSISINLNVLAVSRRGAWIQTTADFDSQVKAVFTSVLVTHSGYSFVKKIGEVRIRTNNPWFGGNENQNFAYALPDSFASVEKFYVQGFSGFYVDVD
jgi:hypothetical protein